MSLHAQLSPEAIEKLRAQKRNNSIGSLIIGILVVVLLGIITGLLMIPLQEKKTPPLFYTFETEKKETPPKPPKFRKITPKDPRSTGSTWGILPLTVGVVELIPLVIRGLHQQVSLDPVPWEKASCKRTFYTAKDGSSSKARAVGI